MRNINQNKSSVKGKVYFVIGTGRCGTTFLYKLLGGEPLIAASHEKHPLNDTFHRYCKWYNLPVDHEGFLKIKERSIEADLKSAEISVESSAYLSFSIKELYERFDASFILLVRAPDKVALSYMNKGWYTNEIELADPDMIPSYQESKKSHHFFGRTLPKGDDFLRWKEFHPYVKLAWFWKILHQEVLGAFNKLPTEQFRIIRLEDLDYDCYLSLEDFLKVKLSMKQHEFNLIKESKPNAIVRNRDVFKPDKDLKKQFDKELDGWNSKFNYSL